MNKILSSLALMAALAVPLSASAYVLGPTSPGKWGSPEYGTGATVTWSVMGGGVSCEAAFLGCSTTALGAFLPGGFLTEIRSAFDAWSKVANIKFVQVADDGAAFNAATRSGDIRIGAHFVDGSAGTLAYSYFPPVNGLSAAGDIFMDTAERWKIGFGGNGYDVFQVVTHEIGHSLGLEHTPRTDALMNAFYTERFRGLQADDIAGARFLYGVRPIPEPSALALFGLGVVGVALRRRQAQRRAG
ncbi:matrixin family metalloprotease [Azohydromonas lata]|uniref:matrixin family metalloprotease n=1 Tax=Azohydromonas lata TaxID=45677 RepID=UPI00082B497A|nr:matrixin family metalloprotease [Azohydromonas lata]